jgi:hypothetical protein
MINPLFFKGLSTAIPDYQILTELKPSIMLL